MSAALSERLTQEHAASREMLSPAVVSAERRSRALETLISQGLPSGRDENWKYANLRPLERVRFAPSAPRPRPDVTLAELPAPILGYARYTFVDGVFIEALSKPATMAGISMTSLRTSGQRAAGAGPAATVAKIGARTAAAATPIQAEPSAAQAVHGARSAAAALPSPQGDERFAELNEAFATDGAVIRVARGVDCPACIEMVFVATEPAQAAASYPRLELQVEADARVGLIERHVSLHDDSNFVNCAVRVNVGRGAQVNHFRVQQAGARAIWFDTLAAAVAQDARYTMYGVSLGALSARSTLHVQLLGERAEAALHVVALGDAQQVHDAFALVEHVAANTRSEQNVRGVAAGRSRIAFNSKVVVREHAKGTDSKQSLRGLLAGTQAEIDVRPQLEIYTDDVRCSHGATAGKLDENMLFYLLSRGIEREIAQQLLKWAFLEDVVSRITIPELRRHIEASLAGQLKETAALQELL